MKGKGVFMKELQEKTPKELVSTRKKLKLELYSLNMKNAVRGLKKTSDISKIRRDIARINTVLKSKLKDKTGQ
ncbi:50S ribosomal protein L29 [Candidatus Gracilibacteria bacterium]|nr:50S ribosomal protein L29 [Candidatus Gracilibacteria bacterium]